MGTKISYSTLHSPREDELQTKSEHISLIIFLLLTGKQLARLACLQSTMH